jgi:hypothetical protein
LVCPRVGWLLAVNSHWLFIEPLAPPIRYIVKRLKPFLEAALELKKGFIFGLPPRLLAARCKQPLVVF